MNQLHQLIYYFNEGGLLMWPLLVCSLIGVAVIIERLVRLRRSKLIDPAVVESIQTNIEEGKLDLAIATNRNSPTLVGRILSRGLEEFVNTSTDIETSLEEAGSRGLQVLHNNLAVLSTIAKVAPLLGLLGTVQGMIMGFEHLELKGVGKEDLAHAIRVALITTFAGLAIAIPVVVANAWFRSRIRRLHAEFEEIFIDVIKTVKSARPPRSPVPEPNTEIVGGRNTP